MEILKNGRLEYKGRLPTQTEPIIWRDMKVIDGYVFIGSEAEGHGLQVFDMRKVSIRSGGICESGIDSYANAFSAAASSEATSVFH